MNYTKSKLTHGYANRILTIDLGTGAIATPDLDPEVRDYFIGGRGLGLYLLHQAITPRTTAYDPENPLILANGPLGGIPQFPGTSKCMAVSLSPLTGIPGVSNFGGYFGAYLKYAGFDALEITGKSDQDCHDRHRRLSAGDLHDGSARRSTRSSTWRRTIVDRFVRAGPRQRRSSF